MIADHDFETYSPAGFIWDEAAGKWAAPPGAKEKGLGTVGAAIYTEHPDAEVLTYRYDLKDGRGSQHWHPGLPNPTDLFSHIASGKPLEAWNTGFERWVWRNICQPKYGWPALPNEVQRCAMAKARAHALPGRLELAAEVTRAAVQKDKEGKRLLDKFSKPRNPTKGDPRWRVLPVWTPDGAEALTRYAQMGLDPAKFPRGWMEADHADTLALDRYCATDIEAEASVSERCPPMEGEELEYWQVDQAVNLRGVAIDRRGVEDCIAIIEQAHSRYNAELLALTGIDAASKVQQLQGWLRARGVHLDSLDEDHVADALTWQGIDPQARRVLQIRSLVGSASVKKVFAMRNTTARDGRIHDLFSYHAARTGRATGNGAQPTNMPNSGPEMRRCGLWVEGKLIEGSGCTRHFRPGASHCPWCGRPDVAARPKVEWSFEAAEDARGVIASRSLALVEAVLGDAMGAVSGVLRGLFVAGEGYDLVSSDYSSIEAVVLAMLAGEQWRIEVFRTHGKIYEASAAQMFGVPLDEILAHKKRTGDHHPLRKLGKVAELALGYAGWIGAAKNFNMPGTDDEIKANIKKWRAASPAVVEFWGGQTRGAFSDARRELFGVEGMAVMALQNPGQWFDVRRTDGSATGVSYCAVGNCLYCRLPSGRLLTYHNCILAPSTRPYAQTWDISVSFEGYNTNPKNGPVGWIRMSTYAGKLVENIVQATARDILRFAMINLERAGYRVVLHVYDEIVAEVRKGEGSVEDFEAIMMRMPAWAADWPIKAAGGWRGFRYRKG